MIFSGGTEKEIACTLVGFIFVQEITLWVDS